MKPTIATLALATFTNSEQVTFGVFTDAACTTPLRTGSDASKRTIGTGECVSFTYTDPSGNPQTNSEDDFNCCATFIEFVQWPGQTNCSATPEENKVIYNRMTTTCESVQTHMGITYQKLMNYSRCAARMDLGYGITSEMCEDAQITVSELPALPDNASSVVLPWNASSPSPSPSSSASSFAFAPVLLALLSLV